MSTPAPSQRLGPYELIASIGKGGMGEVWRARDTRLNREVAVKFSSAEFSDRFQREAQAIAALNHPNICTLHDVGPNYLVMELIEGPTLGDRIQEGAIPLDEALNIARQIADALDAAHEKGIVHRDLKPGNIKIRPDGSVKVLDFGLAKSGPAETTVSHDSPTLMHSPTLVGVILGTAAYMAPEQARGKTVDKRADIWAFGVVLYEMLTGKRLFEGEDLTETLASVVKSEPNLVPVPEKVRPLLEKCLQKDPKKRLRDIGDWTLLLASERVVAAPLQPQSNTKWIAAKGVFALIAAALGGWALLRPRQVEQRPVFLDIASPGKNVFDDQRPRFVLSPDGRKAVFLEFNKDNVLELRLRNMETGVITPLSGTEDSTVPFWSPDSRWIGFYAGHKLQKISVDGGTPQVIVNDVHSTNVATWNRDGMILYDDAPKPIQMVSASGGTSKSAITFDQARHEVAQDGPYFMPDGKHFVYISAANGPDSGLVWASIGGKERRFLLRTQAGPPKYAVNPAGGDGWLLYKHERQLIARPFRPDTGEFRGDPVVIADPVKTGPCFTVSDTGMLSFVRSVPVQTRMNWVLRDGTNAGPLGPEGANQPAISPDQKTTAYVRTDRHGTDIYLFSTSRQTETRITFDGAPKGTIVWSPDGNAILYAVVKAGSGDDAYELRQHSFAEGTDTLIKAGDLERPALGSVSSDGKWLVVTQSGFGHIAAFLVSRPDGKVIPLQEQDTGLIRLSPDRQWLAFGVGIAGVTETIVKSAPPEVSGKPDGVRIQISTNGGALPRWRADSKELFYVTPNGKMMSVPFESGPAGIRPGQPKELFDAGESGAYDVSPDGKRFLVLKPVPGAADVPTTVVLNWPGLMKK